MPRSVGTRLRRWVAVGARHITRFVLAAVVVVVLTSCRLDVVVTVDIEPDGTGTVTMVATADAELVEMVPDVIDDLRLDDAIENGWQTDGPVLQEDGSATITMTHPVSSPEELANVLNSIGPPLSRVAAARTSDETGQVTNAINGEMVLPEGFESFADDDLLARVGGLPFGEEIAASGATPEDAFGFTLRIKLPGELVSAETGTELDDGTIERVAPTDGSVVNIYTETVQRPASEENSWAGPLATVSMIGLVVWIVLAVAFIVFVAIARQRRKRRRSSALSGLGSD